MAFSEYNLSFLNQRASKIQRNIKRDNPKMKIIINKIYIRVHNNGASLCIDYTTTFKHEPGLSFDSSYSEAL